MYSVAHLPRELKDEKWRRMHINYFYKASSYFIYNKYEIRTTVEALQNSLIKCHERSALIAVRSTQIDS